MNLAFFKFEPSAWEAGNIQLCTRDAKGLFIDLCSLYWMRLGELPYAFALQKLCNGNASNLEVLMHHQIFSIDNGNIVIEFLDNQLKEFQDTSGKRREAAEKRWKKSNSNANAMHLDISSNAIRQEKTRGDKTRKEESVRFTPPSAQEVIQFFGAKGYSVESAQRAFDYYTAGGWKDVNGKPVKNWKQKMISVWLKEENKIKAKVPIF